MASFRILFSCFNVVSKQQVMVGGCDISDGIPDIGIWPFRIIGKSWDGLRDILKQHSEEVG